MEKMTMEKNGTERRTRMLIVSVGSLVGQNILDSLEYVDFPRRHLFEITGTNSVAENANMFRCDRSYLVPPTASLEFDAEMVRVIREVEPEVILSARDADTASIWRLLESDPSLLGKFPYGNLATIEAALDKWRSWEFARRNGLPMAETFLVGVANDGAALAAFIDKVGFPFIAKPAQGFASKGVYLVRNVEEAAQFEKFGGYIFQEYLGCPDELDEYFQLLAGPPPLFCEVPGVAHHTCHVPIGPDGELGEVYVLRNHHHFGAVTKLRRVVHLELEALALRYAECMSEEGGWGLLSIQFRPDRHGEYKAQEMNFRTTGSTFARLMMGQDEVGLLMDWLYPERGVPRHKVEDGGFDTLVMKSLNSYKVPISGVGQLQEQGEKGKWW